MRVLLKTDLARRGSAGEIVEVADGYARNYLIPQKLATVATEENIRQAELERQRTAKAEQQRLAEVRESADKINSASCTITVQANEEGVLFGSISADDIVAACAAQGIEIPAKGLSLEHPYKETGIYALPVQLTPEIQATLKVWIVSE